MAQDGVFIKDVKVTPTLSRYLAALSTSGLAASLATANEYLWKKEERMFARQQDPFGNKWAPLTEATKEIRINLGFGPGPINRRTYKLQDYMVNRNPDILGHSDGLMSLVYPHRATPPKDIIKRLEQSEGIKHGATKRSVIGLDQPDIAFVLATINSSLVRSIR